MLIRIQKIAACTDGGHHSHTQFWVEQVHGQDPTTKPLQRNLPYIMRQKSNFRLLVTYGAKFDYLQQKYFLKTSNSMHLKSDNG